ncbi:MAG: AMP-binding protein [Mycobacterium sp.]
MPSTHSVLRDRWYREGWFSGQTLLDAFAAGAQVHGRTPVTFVGGDFDASLTVAEIRRDALNLAAKLQRLGIGPGDVVAVQVTNRPECPAIYQAVLLCGAVLVPIVHIYGTAEVRFILTESAAKVIVMPERWRTTRYHERVQELSEIDTLGQIVLLDAGSGAGYRTFSELPGCAEDYQPPAVCSDEVCLVLYTSGTTSAPKGVQHTHNTVLAEQRTMPALFATTDDTTLVTFPPGHIAGVGAVLRPLLSGARTVFLDSWDPKLASDIVQRFAVTNTAGAPFHLEGILACGDIAHKLATLDEFLVGAAPVSEDLLRRAAAAGITTFRSYGATEHPTVTGEHLGASRLALLSTDGRPMPGSAVRIVGPDGADCACGVDGEVLVQGPEQFVGYQDGALNAVAFTADGWFRTGDLGHLDIDGRLVITDRIKDVIIRGGETISSAQVEEVLYAHPAVCECAVVAAPHPRYGDVVAAVVVLHHGRALDLDEVRAHFALSGLARQKTPEHLVVVDALPRTPLGKVRKADLRDAHFSW